MFGVPQITLFKNFNVSRYLRRLVQSLNEYNDSLSGKQLLKKPINMGEMIHTTYSSIIRSGAKHSKFELECLYDLHPKPNAIRNIQEYCRRVIWSSRCKFLNPE